MSQGFVRRKDKAMSPAEAEEDAERLVSWSRNSSHHHLARHCEERSDEAIQGKRRAMALDCFASLAKTGKWIMRISESGH